jgi:O-antigen/teichoic acid export membrane protein
VVGLLAGSIVALGANAVTMSEISLKRRTIFFTRYAIYAAVLNIALNFLLIPPWDIVGAALATLITYGALAAMYYWRAQRLEAAPFEPRSVVLVIAVTAVLVGVGTFVHFDSLWLSVVVKLPLVLAFPAVLRLVGVLEPGWLGTMLEWTRTFFREGIRAPA